MNDIEREIVDALEEQESDLGSQILTLPSNAQIPCVPSMEDVGSQIAIGPNIEEIACVVRVRKSHFITVDSTEWTVDTDVILSDSDVPPLRPGKKPTFRFKTYRVLRVQESPCMAYFKIFLGSAK